MVAVWIPSTANSSASSDKAVRHPASSKAQCAPQPTRSCSHLHSTCNLHTLLTLLCCCHALLVAGHDSDAWKLVGPYMRKYGRCAIANSQLFNPEFTHFFVPGVGSIAYIIADM